jgi:hypothetical protein
MSEDREQIVDGITDLSIEIITAYIRYVNNHRQIDSASALTATAFFVSIVVDVLSFGEDDPTEKEIMATLVDAATRMLENKTQIRHFTGDILKTVLEEEMPQ